MSLTLYNAGEETSYRLVRELQHGQEGMTFEAEQLGPDGRRLAVALKVLNPASYLSTKVDRELMLRKWRGQMHVMRSFSHPGFASVQVAFPISAPPGVRPGDFPADLIGTPAFVMAWIEGEQLDEWSATQPDPVVRLDVLRQSAEGLDRFHAKTRHVHCDLKPANVMVEDGRTCIVDFGLVRMADPDRSASLLAGSIPYMDPAIIETHRYTVETDRYSFAGILFHQLTGDHPVPSRTAPKVGEALANAGFGAVAPVLAYALSPDPELRPPIEGAVDLLDRVLERLSPVRPSWPRNAVDPAELPTVPANRLDDPAPVSEARALVAQLASSIFFAAALTVVVVIALRAMHH